MEMAASRQFEFVFASTVAEMAQLCSHSVDSVCAQRAACSLGEFIAGIVRRAALGQNTLFVALVLVRRALRRMRAGSGCVLPGPELALAALLVAHKVLTDSRSKNKHWSLFVQQMFSPTEINRMEYQLLCLLDYRTFVSESDILLALPQMLGFNPVVTEKPAPSNHSRINKRRHLDFIDTSVVSDCSNRADSAVDIGTAPIRHCNDTSDNHTTPTLSSPYDAEFDGQHSIVDSSDSALSPSYPTHVPLTSSVKPCLKRPASQELL